DPSGLQLDDPFQDPSPKPRKDNTPTLDDPFAPNVPTSPDPLFDPSRGVAGTITVNVGPAFTSFDMLPSIPPDASGGCYDQTFSYNDLEIVGYSFSGFNCAGANSILEEVKNFLPFANSIRITFRKNCPDKQKCCPSGTNQRQTSPKS